MPLLLLFSTVTFKHANNKLKTYYIIQLNCGVSNNNSRFHSLNTNFHSFHCLVNPPDHAISNYIIIVLM